MSKNLFFFISGRISEQKCSSINGDHFAHCVKVSGQSRSYQERVKVKFDTRKGKVSYTIKLTSLLLLLLLLLQATIERMDRS